MMSDEHGYHLSGLLLDWPRGHIERSDLLRCRALQFAREVPGSRWEEFVFSSDVPLRKEDAENVQEPFRYAVICRRSGSRILLSSVGRQIVEHLLEKVLSETFIPRLRRVSIAVNDLVKAMAARPTIYALSFVHARVPAFGTSLRSVSFYGDDLAEASLFRDNMPLMNFFTCGLRPTVGGAEIVRVAGDGTLSFYMASPDRVMAVENALGFLRREGYLSTSIWPHD